MSIVNLIAIVVIPIVAVIIGQMLQNRAAKKKLTKFRYSKF